MEELNRQVLEDLVRVKMPFGKYKDRFICDLPVHYLEWFAREGFPKGKLGMLLSTMLVIKSNGLDYLLRPLKNRSSSA
jgi:hypothetical protein